MKSIMCPVPLPVLIDDVLAVELSRVPDGSGHAKGPETAAGWIRGLSMARVPKPANGPAERHLPAIWRAVDDLCTMIEAGRSHVAQVMINRLEPGCALKVHRDGPPVHERWHLPVVTNPAVRWWDALYGDVIMRPGVWHGPVPYVGVRHSMTNAGEHPRYHIVVDIDRTVGMKAKDRA